MNNTYKILIVIVIILIIYYFIIHDTKEHFNDSNAKFCYSCKGKTYNQCLGCFNCGFCVDKWGNSECIGGDMSGPYNYEKCYRFYYNDPYIVMKEHDANYKCSYGPTNSNRRIGINVDQCNYTPYQK